MSSGRILTALVAVCLSGDFLSAQATTADWTHHDALRPDSVIELPGVPRILRIDTPGADAVVMRLSVQFAETPAEAGVGEVLARLARARTAPASGPVGTTVSATRTPWSVAYSVQGSLADFDFLAFILRRAVARPSPSSLQIERARSALTAELLRSRETAGGRVIAELRSALAPGVAAAEGTLESLERLNEFTVIDAWERSHRPESMTLVVVGDVTDELLLSAFGDLTLADGSPVTAPELGSSSSRRRTQVLRRWYGEAVAGDRALDPRMAVAAVLLSEELRAGRGDFEAELQLWDLPDRQAIAVVGAAYARSARTMRSAIQGLRRAALQSISEEKVEAAKRRIRAAFLLEAATPAGLAGLIGRHADASADPAAAALYLDELRALDLPSVVSFMRALADRAAVRAEVRP